MTMPTLNMNSTQPDLNTLAMTFQDRVLHRTRYSSQLAFSKELLSVEGPNPMFVHGIEQMVIRLNAYVFAEQLGVYKHTFPANWWEHLKAAHAPRWFRDKYPVKYTTVELEGVALFPQYVPPTGIGQHKVVVREAHMT